MIKRKNPTLTCADAGPFNAAFFNNPALHQVYDGKIESQSAMPCQENQHSCTACRHTVIRFAHQAMQP